MHFLLFMDLPAPFSSVFIVLSQNKLYLCMRILNILQSISDIDVSNNI